MQVALKSPYLSIVEFPAIELPAFTVITGVNGSGKTHLLKGIHSGNITVDVAPDHNADTRYFDWTNLVPNDDGAVDGRGPMQVRERYWNQVEQAVRPHRQSMSDAARSAGLPTELWRDPRALALLKPDDFNESLTDLRAASALHTKLQSELKNATRDASTQISRQGAPRTLIQEIEEKLQLPVLAMERGDFLGAIPVDWGETNPFQQHFAKLFVAYRNLKLENELKALAKQKGVNSANPLSDEEFEARYNTAPWDFVNSTLRDAGLDFTIDSPYPYEQWAYRPSLQKRSTNAKVSFGDLSSGEKVLMSFALCLYYSKDCRQIAKYPRLLLLDEVDSPLHPSMSRQLIQTITETLVQKQKLNVILATHSPTTVALAPEDSLYIMRPDSPRLSKVTKGHALNILTSGVPTLAISCDGRRQIIVESDIDARIYDCLYQALKSVIESDRSLVFIGAGAKPLGGNSHQNGGCASVTRIVEALALGGNLTVLGLVDWDKRNITSGRVHVLAEGIRYSIENCMYDPLLLAAFVAQEEKVRPEDIGLSSDEKFISFVTLTPTRLQAIAERIQQLVLGDVEEWSENVLVDSYYHGGHRISLRRSYLHYQGHDLEAKIKHVFPSLCRYQHPGDLMEGVVKRVVANIPSLVPRDLIDTIRGLLDAEIMAS